MTVDLKNQRLAGSDGFACSFDLDPFFKRCLLEGLDEISMTQQHEEDIKAYENSHHEPWRIPATKSDSTMR
jgi:3-isopropylmalate/(R)-2-methylmalate dehydratase small subunit